MLRYARQHFWRLCGLTLAVRLWLAAILPITGDEAYFHAWGRHPDWGYYDHPPMIGWWMTALLTVSDHVLWLRLPSLLAPVLMAVGLADLLQRLQPSPGNARQTALPWQGARLYLLLPTSVLGVLITNDTPLILFVFASAYAFLRAQLAESGPETGASPDPAQARAALYWYMAAGALLGLAFLSKYFAVLIALAYALILLRAPAGVWPGLKRLLLLAGCALPFVLENLAFNLWHCWDNIMFNAFNRNVQVAQPLKTLPAYLLMLALALPPWLFWLLWQGRRQFARRGPQQAVLLLGSVPLLFLLVLSLKKSIGLHWIMAFLPFPLLATLLVLGARQQAGESTAVARWLQRTERALGGFSLLLALLVSTLLLLPSGLLYSHTGQGELVFLKQQQSLARQAAAEATRQNAVLMATVYTPAAMLGYALKRDIPVFGPGSFHARQDDSWTDFRDHAGKNLTLFGFGTVDPAVYAPFFRQIQVTPIVQDGAAFWLLTGQGFDYARYHESVLRDIRQRYYRIPDFLPQHACPFAEKYGFSCRSTPD